MRSIVGSVPCDHQKCDYGLAAGLGQCIRMAFIERACSAVWSGLFFGTGGTISCSNGGFILCERCVAIIILEAASIEQVLFTIDIRTNIHGLHVLPKVHFKDSETSVVH